MLTFLAEHIIEVIFGLVSAGALAFCRYLYKQLKSYKQMLEEKKYEDLDERIDEKLRPILDDIEEIREYIRETEKREQKDLSLIVASYRFRLVQLCKLHIKKGHITQDEYDQLTEFFKLYTSLGGNGQAKEYYDKAVVLPIRPE